MSLIEMLRVEKKLPNSQRTLLLSLNMCVNPGRFVGVNMSLHSAAATLTGEKDTEFFFVGGGGRFRFYTLKFLYVMVY